MKDFLYRELAVDDYVIFAAPYNGGMKLGKIVKFTLKQVRVEYPSWQGKMTDTLKYSDQVVRVEGPDLTFFLLSKHNQGQQ